MVKLRFIAAVFKQWHGLFSSQAGRCKFISRRTQVCGINLATAPRFPVNQLSTKVSLGVPRAKKWGLTVENPFPSGVDA